MMRHLVLGLLRDGGARHGYALMKAYRDGAARPVSVGNLYRELQRLLRAGLVRAGVKSPDADPRQIPYEITDAGRAEFDAWLDAPPRYGGDGDGDDDEQLLRAWFAVTAEAPLAGRVLGRWREHLEMRARLFARACADAADPDAERPGVPTLALWLDRRLRHLAVDLDFVRQLEAAVAAARPRHLASVPPPGERRGVSRAARAPSPTAAR